MEKRDKILVIIETLEKIGGDHGLDRPDQLDMIYLKFRLGSTRGSNWVGLF